MPHVLVEERADLAVLYIPPRTSGESDWSFEDWYVNLQAPYVRSRLGFDTRDHQLDIVVAPEGTWRWKDEDHLALGTRLGVFTPEEAAEIRAEGEHVIADWPFPTGWEDWRPDPAWPIPQLPVGWNVVRDLA